MQDNRNSGITNFFQQNKQATTARLLLDYDGTLAPFQTDRFHAYPYPGVIPILDRIIQANKTKVAIISGRPIKEIQNLLSPLENLEIWGAHGLEHISADGIYERAEIDPEVLSILQQAEDWLHQTELMSAAEIKPGGIAVHWRGLSEKEIERIQGHIQKGWSRFNDAPGIKLLSFDGGVEIRAAYPNKGDAIHAILAGLDSTIPIAFLGDDLTDEDAFRVLGNRGLSVLVRSDYRETAANAWLQPPQELIAFLESWAETFS